MSDLKTRCAACGLPGHRYGRNEGMDRYDPMACINQLRGVLGDLLANGQRVEWCEEHGSSLSPARVCLKRLRRNRRASGPCRIVSKFIVDPTIQEVTGE